MLRRTRKHRTESALPQWSQQADSAHEAQPDHASQLTASRLLTLQRQVGNRAVMRMLGRHVVQREEVGNQFYGHGAFMGAAPQMLKDPKWSQILQTLMPDVWADVSKVTDDGKLIPMMENNPVMAAYGVVKTKQMDDEKVGGRSDRIEKMEAFEWDVFLPDATVKAYHKAKTPEEREQLAQAMVENMIIAHGNKTQTVFENKFGSRQYGSVRETRKTGFGGAMPGAWMDLFGRALQLAGDPKWEEKLAEYQDPDKHPRHTDQADQSNYQTFKNRLSFREVIDLYKQMFGKETFSVLLDIKSRDATSDILQVVIQQLNKMGVHVYGVGTFTFSELTNLSQMQQTVDGKTYGGPHEIKFYHGIGSVQADCLDGKIREGDHVMFNAGSILTSMGWKPDAKEAASDQIPEVIAQLGKYKDAYKFHIGLYVQEGDTDKRAAAKITELSNRYANIIDLGFAWGGLSNEMGSVTSGDTGLGSQSMLSKDWNAARPVPSGPANPSNGFKSTFELHHRFLKSRVFAVQNNKVIVTATGKWSPEDVPIPNYHMTLVQEGRIWDSDIDSAAFPIGRTHSMMWGGLNQGNYYLQIWLPTDTNPEHVLHGDIDVEH